MKTKIHAITSIMLLAATAHCGPKSGYTPMHAPAQEIVWRFDGGLEAVKNAETVASAPGFTGLGDAVACVPEAAAEAGDASRAHYASWGFMGIGLGATAGGAGLAVASAFETDTDMLWVALGTLGGGLVMTLIGTGINAAVLPNAVDAVNIYNDRYEAVPDCNPIATR